MSKNAEILDQVLLFDLAYQYYKKENGLLAIDIGYSMKDGLPEKNVAVRVHFLGRKPQTVNRPSGGENIELLFFDNMKAKAKASRKTAKWRVIHTRIKPGISIGAKLGGSCGLIGKDKRTGKPAMLTCQHIFERKTGQYTYLYQPAPKYYPLSYHSLIGRWERSLPNSDVAIVHLNQWRSGINKIFTTNKENHTINTMRAVKLGDVLIKSGATTGLTKALVDGIGLFFPFRSHGRKPISVFRLIPIRGSANTEIEISAPGDSGAIWLDPTTKAGVGLHIAGEPASPPQQEFAFALPLKEIADKINFVLP